MPAQEEVVRKTQSFERLKVEAEKCLAQSEKINDEKVEFESAIYEKVCSISYFVFSASYIASNFLF